MTDKGWHVEIAFPFSALEVTPRTGTKWAGNFCRLYRMNRLPFSTWSHMPRNWHAPKGYGVLELR